MIVVLGLYRGGSSCVAGVLHHLGVCMGHEIKRIPLNAGETAPYVCWEDWPMRRTTLACYRERELEPLKDYGARVAALRRYLTDRTNQRLTVKESHHTIAIPYENCDCDPMGVKDPMLCYMGPEIAEAWGDDTAFVAVDRDVQTAANSAARWYGSKSDAMTRSLYEAREGFLSGRDHVRVSYSQLVADPTGQVEMLARSLRLQPTATQLTNAMRSVRRPERWAT